MCVAQQYQATNLREMMTMQSRQVSRGARLEARLRGLLCQGATCTAHARYSYIPILQLATAYV